MPLQEQLPASLTLAQSPPTRSSSRSRQGGGDGGGVGGGLGGGGLGNGGANGGGGVGGTLGGTLGDAHSLLGSLTHTRVLAAAHARAERVLGLVVLPSSNTLYSRQLPVGSLGTVARSRKSSHSAKSPAPEISVDHSTAATSRSARNNCCRHPSAVVPPVMLESTETLPDTEP